MSDQRFGKLLDATLIIQLTAFAAILLDIPLLRQVIGFLYLSFLPGFLVLKTIRLDKTSRMENLLFSVGLSLTILMFIGLLSNEIYPALNISRPLSVIPLIATIFAFTLVFYVASYYRSKNLSMETMSISNIKFSRLFPLLVCLPIITVLGTEMLISSGNNLILLVLVIITAVIVLCTFSRKLVLPQTYLLLVLVISLFLLLHVSLISKYIIGYDVHLEYYFANLTSSKSTWIETIPHEYDDMLSITILPVLFSNCLNLDLNWVFKAVYPLIFSLVPLTLFVTYRKLTSSRIAFLSVFFFVSMDVFYFTMLGLARQMIAELFFALLILLTLENKMSQPKRKLLFIIFSAALIVSHYALSYIFLFYISVTFCLLHLLKRSDAENGNFITGDLGLLYVAMAVVWYVLVSQAPFNALATTVNHIYQSILAQVSAPGISGLMPHYVSPLHQVSQYLFYGLQLSIIVGFLGSIVRHRETKFTREYLSMSLISLLILIACMALPSFAANLAMSRFYHITSFLLAPFVVLGFLTVFDLIMDLRSRLPTSKVGQVRRHDVESKGVGLFLISLLLVAFFLFQVGFVYEISGDIPSSLSLSMKSLQTNPTRALDIWDAQTPEQDVFSAKWLLEYGDNQSKVYADKTSSFMVLTSYGMLPIVFFSANSRVGSYDYILSPTTVKLLKNAYVYLRELNVVYGTMDDSQGKTWNTTELSPLLNNSNEIYTNGESEIYQNP
jgi:uncharacterized membrane protein